MRHSEFWNALEQAFGSAAGHSLAQDLVLVPFDMTALEALDKGTSPVLVWNALIDEIGADEQTRWIYRRPVKKKS